MKKLLVFMCAGLMGLFMASCSGDNASGSIEKAKAIVEDLQKNAKDLSVDQIKEKMLDFAGAIKPIMEKINAITEKVKADPSKAADAFAEMEKLGLGDIETLMGQLQDAVAQNPKAAELAADNDFGKVFAEALGAQDVEKEVADEVAEVEEQADAVADKANDIADKVGEAAEKAGEVATKVGDAASAAKDAASKLIK